MGRKTHLGLPDKEWYFFAPPDNMGKTVTIMADFGNGPYAWLKDTSDKSDYVGSCIADVVTGIMEPIEASDALERDFSDWVIRFENHYDDPDFDWPGFHVRGIELGRRLLQETGGRYHVEYVKPVEAPDHEIDSKTIIS